MTLLQLEEVNSEDDLLAPETGLLVKCSWCGEIMKSDGTELVLAMCQTCYDRMLAEYLRTQQPAQPFAHASDR